MDNKKVATTIKEFFMKKLSLITLAIVLVLGFIMASCKTTYQYEKEAPLETQAILMWTGKEINVVALDEVGVKWKVKSVFFGSLGTSTVYLPPGPHTLTVDYKSNLGKANAIHVGENFKAGRTYLLRAIQSGGLFSSSVSLEIIEQGTR